MFITPRGVMASPFSLTEIPMTASQSIYRQFLANEIFLNVFDDEKRIDLPGMLLTGYADETNPAIPNRNDDYIFRKEVLRSVIAFLQRPNGDALFISGPTGSGKTSVVTEVAARLNWPVEQITLNGRFEFSQLKGQFVVVSPAPGEAPVMTFMYGPLAKAMKHGEILLLNEIDLADPAELAGLNDVLEGRPLVIPENGGEIIRPHPMFRVVATANSFGNGDATGLYQGVQQQNLAALDRYRLLEVDYASPYAEETVLRKALSKNIEPMIPLMVKLANDIRALFKGDDDPMTRRLSVTMSTRTLIRWGKLAEVFRGAPNVMKFSLEQALLLRADPADQQTINALGKAVFGAKWQRTPRKKKTSATTETEKTEEAAS